MRSSLQLQYEQEIGMNSYLEWEQGRLPFIVGNLKVDKQRSYCVSAYMYIYIIIERKNLLAFIFI